MQRDTPVKRRYRSSLRESQARATRRGIVEAAQRLFVAHGYGATSVDAIAEAAGVSRATVFGAFGSKAALLKRAYDVALVGDDEPVAFPDRPDSLKVKAETDAGRFLEGYAGLVIDVLERVSAMYEVVRGAASLDPEVRAVWEKIQSERLIGGRNVVAGVLDRGGLGAGVDAALAADLVYAFVDPGFYHVLVHLRGWSTGAYRDWLARTLRRELTGS